MAHPFLDRLSHGPILGDGAMGTMLHARGAALEQCLEELSLTAPGLGARYPPGLHPSRR